MGRSQRYALERSWTLGAEDGVETCQVIRVLITLGEEIGFALGEEEVAAAGGSVPIPVLDRISQGVFGQRAQELLQLASSVSLQKRAERLDVAIGVRVGPVLASILTSNEKQIQSAILEWCHALRCRG